MEAGREQGRNTLSTYLLPPCWCFPLFEPRTWVQGSSEDAVSRGRSPGAQSRTERGWEWIWGNGRGGQRITYLSSLIHSILWYLRASSDNVFPWTEPLQKLPIALRLKSYLFKLALSLPVDPSDLSITISPGPYFTPLLHYLQAPNVPCGSKSPCLSKGSFLSLEYHLLPAPKLPNPTCLVKGNSFF